jgi:hypothetical protein
MKQSEPNQIVRILHRWSGMLLIVVILIKILSGWSAVGYPGKVPAQFHVTFWVDVPLLFLFILHALYGIFKIIQAPVKNKVLLFMSLNILGLLLFIGSLFLSGTL